LPISNAKTTTIQSFATAMPPETATATATATEAGRAPLGLGFGSLTLLVSWSLVLPAKI